MTQESASERAARLVEIAARRKASQQRSYATYRAMVRTLQQKAWEKSRETQS